MIGHKFASVLGFRFRRSRIGAAGGGLTRSAGILGEIDAFHVEHTFVLSFGGQLFTSHVSRIRLKSNILKCYAGAVGSFSNKPLSPKKSRKTERDMHCKGQTKEKDACLHASTPSSSTLVSSLLVLRLSLYSALVWGVAAVGVARCGLSGSLEISRVSRHTRSSLSVSIYPL